MPVYQVGYDTFLVYDLRRNSLILTGISIKVVNVADEFHIAYGVQNFSLIPKVIAMPQTVARKLDKKVRIQDFVSFFTVSSSLSCEASVA